MRAAVVGGWVGLLGAISGAASLTAPPRYLADHLRCARFAESVRTRIRGESGTATVTDAAGRDGILVVRGRDSTGQGIAIEAWYDTLAVWRTTDTGRESPDVDAVVGGRYRGVLRPTGEYLGRTVPFLPDEVADVADLSLVMNEFFPVLPPVDLAIGKSWRDSTGLEIRRVPDRRDGGETMRRFEWTGVRRLAQRTEFDSLTVMVDQLIREKGALDWSPRLGPVAWTRHLLINASVPARGGVRRPMTSAIEQEISVSRRFDLESCGGSGGGG